MTIDESKIVEETNESLALACLLADDVVFPMSIERKGGGITTGIYVLCNDVFAWACSDLEPIISNDNEAPSEIIDLYKLHKENIKYGWIKWVCLKRNEQPQGPLKKYMQDAGYWNDQLEALPENQYDAAWRDHNNQ
ncbi:hypothetical protein GCM10028807_62760 [Spirosoma daeguense]